MAATKIWHKLGGSINTANATPAAIVAMPTVSNVVHVIEATVVLKTGALSGASFVIIGTFKNTAGTLTQIGATTVVHSQVDAALSTAACAFVISGTNVTVQATGIAATSIDWSAYVDRGDC